MRNCKALAIGVSLLIVSASLFAAPNDSVASSQSEANRQLVVTFYNQFFNRHDTDAAAKVVAEGYRQHNPQVSDGKKPFVSYFKGYFQQHPQSHAQIIRSAVDGDLVWLHIHSTESPQDRGQAIVDIFRVDHGKIVEHWDVIQAIPENAANGNSMF
ncbi:nuclear transport factor 2 family protein [Rosenbergiella australiborealis]|uniref:SnoaL-like domain-containing protein n=1 Tax=Rosenbergiella australiborealis TaxID=1544696 RepID=A0ABS5T0S7_9GAMM|nr:nuclear transport factor 2 family protein [Rosenbergiella australiborealis]MBT0725931.1 SnoaL-like domain-containing protein [Rosenbergiella australiborealis]